MNAPTPRPLVIERAGDPRTEAPFEDDTFRERLASGYYSRRIEYGLTGVIVAVVAAAWVSL